MANPYLPNSQLMMPSLSQLQILCQERQHARAFSAVRLLQGSGGPVPMPAVIRNQTLSDLYAIHDNAMIYKEFSTPQEVIAQYHNKKGFATQSQIIF
jgi:hypothetical protein